jgi:hypothetical protein
MCILQIPREGTPILDLFQNLLLTVKKEKVNDRELNNLIAARCRAAIT